MIVMSALKPSEHIRLRFRPGRLAGACLIAAAFLAGTPHAPAAGLVRIGVLAKRGMSRCLERWAPTAAYLDEQIPEYAFAIVPLDFQQVEAAVIAGDVDFVLVNPAMYVQLEARHRVSRLVTLCNETSGVTKFGGVIFCRADRADIRTLADLRGKRFAAVDEDSFGGWLVAWRELAARGIHPGRDFDSLQFSGTHDAVVCAVRDGEADAGTVRTGTLEHLEQEGAIKRNLFRVIHVHKSAERFPLACSTRLYPEWPLARVRGTSPRLARRVALALLAMPPDCPAAQAAHCAGWTIPANYQSVHACLRELHVAPYAEPRPTGLLPVLRRYWQWVLTFGVFALLACGALVHVLSLNRRLRQSRAGLVHELERRRQIEQELRESRARHRAITTLAQDAIITADADGTIRFWNPAAERIFGYGASETLGRNMIELIVPPEYHDAKRRGLADFARGGAAGKSLGRTLELTALRKDGGRFPIEISVSAYEDEHGRQAIALVRDVSKQVRVREQLKKAHEMTSRLIDAIPSILVAVDGENRITAWNGTAADLLGISAADAVGRSLNTIRTDWDFALLADAIARARGSHEVTQVAKDVHFRRPDGDDGLLGVTICPMGQIDDCGESLLIVAADVTERRRLETQLRQAQKLESIGQLAAGIAHEINTPTQFVGDNIRFLQDAFRDLADVLKRYAQLLDAARDGQPPPDLLREVQETLDEADLDYLLEEIPTAIEQSLDGVDRVAKIVRSMKEFSHPGTREKQLVDLNKAIESTITVARNEWKYVAEMQTDFDPELPPVPCWVSDFNEVILNIVVNAAHAIADVVGDSGEKGRITVTTRRCGDEIEVRVSDTGTGIPEDIRARIFDPFFTTKEVGKGTGQGLAVAHAVVVEKHGGTIRVESEVGQGTTFIIRLPIEPADAETSQKKVARDETQCPVCG